MPQMVTITVNKSFKPEGAAEKEQFEVAKKLGDKEVAYATAVEAVANSRGMYEIKEDKSVFVTPSVWHADKSNEDLKIMLLGLGIKTEKQMRRSDIIGLIEKKAAEIEVVDDTES